MIDPDLNELVGKLVSRDGMVQKKSNGKVFIHDYSDVGEFKGLCIGWKTFDPCNNPADAWPIITGNYISLMYEESLGKWCAGKPYWVDGCEWQLDIDVIDENPLRAAMIVFLQMQESANVQGNPA